jgi:hypothetical protein
MNLTTSYLILNNDLNFNLLQWIIWLPFKIFTNESIGKIFNKKKR